MGLESGCCPEPEPATAVADGAAKRYLIYGRVFNTARDEHGNHLSAGVLRKAGWVAIPQVVTAIRMLERIARPRLLFAAEIHDPCSPDLRTGRSLAVVTMANRVEKFTAWVNEHSASHDRHGEAVPRQEGERIGTMRFRRTVAWHGRSPKAR
ncbi:hypothetical protein [Sphaerisporangium aureirubrum]|uniref:Uncharacterized protein n=1 Tax=Sphaerisporangium aureirubrum TaxID=1544736 RepID=A0ABW1NL72_9ACTN